MASAHRAALYLDTGNQPVAVYHSVLSTPILSHFFKFTSRRPTDEKIIGLVFFV